MGIASMLVVGVVLVLLGDVLNITEGCGRRGGGRSGPPPDRSRPSLTCPPTIRDHAERGQTYAWIRWDEPIIAHDNIDGRITARRSGQAPNTRFTGTTEIGYSATDRAGNHASCTLCINITVVRCSASDNINNGYFIYHPGMDWRYGGISTYGCYRGYVLNGHRILECHIGDGVNGQWSASTPLCQKISCSPLPSIDRADISCTDNYRYESQCTYTCFNGYDVESGVGRIRVCSHRRLWLGTEPTCVDVENPVWNSCPTNMIQYTNRGMSSSTPTWLRPTVSDNSGEDITPILTHGFEPGSNVPVGTYQIMYEATDSAGNSARPCSFVINIRNVRCPRIYPTPYLVASCPNGYDWGESCTFSCQDDYDLIGLSAHSCEAPGTPPLPTWTYGLNMPSCEGQTCPGLTAPDNGALVCDLWLYGSFCKMFCSDDYDVPPSSAGVGRDLFVCGLDTGQWNHPTVPDCSRGRRGSRYNMDLEVHYFVDDCCDPAVQLALQHSFIDILTNHQQFSEACTLQDDECRVDNTRVLCGPECPSEEERKKRSLNNNIKSHYRQRRSVNQYVLQIQARIIIPMPHVPNSEAYEEVSNWFNTFVVNLQTSGDLNDLQVENASTTLSSFDYGRAQLGCHVGYEPTESGACVGCEPGSYFDLDADECQPCLRGTYHDEDSDDGCVSCPVGKSTARAGAQSATECEDACRLGTYSSTGTGQCSPCMQGTYANNLGSLVCTDCPYGTNTATVESTSPSDCQKYELSSVPSDETRSYASYDTYLDNIDVLAITFKLYIDHILGISNIFKLEIGDTSASVTVNSNMTLSTSVTGCTFDPTETTYLKTENWNNIYFEINLIDGRIEHLQLNNYEINTSTDCEDTSPYESGNLTISFGRFDFDADFGGKFSDVNLWNYSLSTNEITRLHTECIPAVYGTLVSWDDLRDSQLFGATIQVPSDCDVGDECSTEPCGRHPCVDAPSSYYCNCYPGFTGVNCETNFDDCIQHSCEENSTCIDGANDYACECPSDMRGRFCEFERVDGGWSEWGEWAICSASCTGGVQTRVHTCTQPVSGLEGSECAGEGEETQECNTHDCPVCAELVPPLNGGLDCHIDQPDYMNCSLVCEEGYGFSVEPLPFYLCDPDTTFYLWNFQADDNPNAQMPACTEIIAAKELESDHAVSYSDMPCSSRNYNAHQELVSQNMVNLGCISSGVCTWDMDVHNCNRNGRHGKRSADVISFDIYIRINQDQIPSNLTNQDVIDVYDPLVVALIDTATELYNLVDNGSFTVYAEDDVYYVAGQEVNPIIVCPYDGMVYDDFYCLPCESGTYGDNGACYPCDYGTYQNFTGQLRCNNCPSGYSTPGRRSRSVTECTVEVPISDNSKKDEATDDRNLALAVALPIAILVIIGLIVAIVVKVYLSKSDTEKNASDHYDVTDDKFKSQPNSRPPRLHTAKMTRPKTANIVTTNPKPIDQSTRHQVNRLIYEKPIPTICTNSEDVEKIPSTSRNERLIDQEFLSNSIPPLLHENNFVREKSSLTQRPITGRTSTRSSVSVISVSGQGAGKKDYSESRPNSAISVTGLAFKPGDALPFIGD